MRASEQERAGGGECGDEAWRRSAGAAGGVAVVGRQADSEERAMAHCPSVRPLPVVEGSAERRGRAGAGARLMAV